ncbi:hypothetical protein EUGRSUZ_I01056 [Eucalyptus grandis]|uniref:Uncharacterized protein n=2 Tax=Eucalyptus grandis TaxID=71139 RepID=A0ACC3JF00_EUCGR|nr:hypothetical protein EUGRSUZ_I01056 [Eucalyptus grandis]
MNLIIARSGTLSNPIISYKLLWITRFLVSILYSSSRIGTVDILLLCSCSFVWHFMDLAFIHIRFLVEMKSIMSNILNKNKYSPSSNSLLKIL